MRGKEKRNRDTGRFLRRKKQQNLHFTREQAIFTYKTVYIEAGEFEDMEIAAKGIIRRRRSQEIRRGKLRPAGDGDPKELSERSLPWLSTTTITMDRRPS